MRILGALLGVLLILLVLVDGFESILQPRRVTRKYRWARFFYRGTWAVWRRLAGRIRVARRQAAFLSIYGPLSLLGIFATWVLGLILGFALLNWSVARAVNAPGMPQTFATYLYMSGTNFFTLGYGDITPASSIGRVLAVSEAGLGFAFLAAILSYLPILFQAYSRREASIALLDARAGSPPSASELLIRMARAGGLGAIDPMLAEWEKWSAELLESQLSFPVLSFYRSQHDNQSWLAALTTMMDACSFLMTQVQGLRSYQAQVTFAMARHAAVDLALIMNTSPPERSTDRLPPAALQSLRNTLREDGVALADEQSAAAKLRELRSMYEPFVEALAARLLLTLPHFVAESHTPDNWQRSSWMRPAPGIGRLPLGGGLDEHFG